MTDDPAQPRTEAGKELLDLMAGDPCDCAVHRSGVELITRIEDEAEDDYRVATDAAMNYGQGYADGKSYVLAMLRHEVGNSGPETGVVQRAGVLAVIDRLAEESR